MYCMENVVYYICLWLGALVVFGLTQEIACVPYGLFASLFQFPSIIEVEQKINHNSKYKTTVICLLVVVGGGAASADAAAAAVFIIRLLNLRCF